MMNETPSRPSTRNRKRFFSFLLIATIVASLIVVARYFNVQELLRNALLWIANLGPWGPVAFVVIYNLATVLFLPGSLLTLGGGVIFGVIWGSIYVFIAATLGATFAFIIGRYAARGWVSHQIEGNPKFKAIDRAVAREGFKIVLLTRLSPIFPFNLLNYALGVTQVSLKDYLLGSIGMIPGTIMYVYIGSLAGDLAMLNMKTVSTNPQAETTKWIINIVGFIATVAVTVYITRVARKALEETI